MLSTAEILTLVRRQVNALNSRDPAVFAAGYAPDATSAQASGQTLQGRQAIAENFRQWLQAFPDARFEVTQCLASARNTCVLEFTMSATHTGPLTTDSQNVIQPTGRPVQITAAVVATINGQGQIQSEFRAFDNGAVMEQLGLLPAPLTESDIHGLIERSIAAWNRHDPDGIAATYSESCQVSFAGLPQAVGRQAVRESAQAYFVAFPDLQLAIDSVQVDGTRTATTWSSRGTHRGPFGNIAATGKTVQLQGCTLAEVDQTGLVRASRIIYDRVSLLRQLGVIPG